MCKKMKEIAKTIGNVKFWGITVFLFVVLTAVSYWATGFVTEGNYIEKYQKLDPLVKELFSLESWWVEMLISGCIPMFLLFSIQFYLLKFDPKNEYRDIFNSVLPFVPMLKWLTNKPIYFMLGTASVFLGVIIYLAVEGGVAYLAGLIIPVPIFMLTFLLKYASAQIASGEGFTEWTYDNNKSIGTGCATISLACWLYINVLSPSCELWTVFSALSVS